MTIADAIRAALRSAGFDGMPIVQTGDGRVEVYVPRTHGAAVFSAVGAAIDKTGLRALPMVPAYGWFVTSGPAPTGAPPPETGQPGPPTTDDALDVGPLFDTPQITTTDAGHWLEGREYVAVDVDGELDYRPKEEA